MFFSKKKYSISGRVVLITGAASGIGQATAVAAARAGAGVVVLIALVVGGYVLGAYLRLYGEHEGPGTPPDVPTMVLAPAYAPPIAVTTAAISFSG